MIEAIGYFFLSISLGCALVFCYLMLSEGWREYKANKGNAALGWALVLVMMMTIVVAGGAYLFEQHVETMRIINK